MANGKLQIRLENPAAAAAEGPFASILSYSRLPLPSVSSPTLTPREKMRGFHQLLTRNKKKCQRQLPRLERRWWRKWQSPSRKVTLSVHRMSPAFAWTTTNTSAWSSSLIHKKSPPLQQNADDDDDDQRKTRCKLAKNEVCYTKTHTNTTPFKWAPLTAARALPNQLCK